jgi:Tfp pilus assembly protein PilV
MLNRKRRVRGVMLLEVVVTLMIVLSVLGMLSVCMSQYTSGLDAMLARQRGIMAAEAVLNEIRAGAEPSNEAFKARFDRMEMSIGRTPGEGAWGGLTRVDVAVTVRLNGNQSVTCRLVGYVREAPR